MARGKSIVVEIESLYRARYRQFLRVATAIVGDEAAAHDAVQEGFAVALKERRSFRGVGPLEGWVWRVVFNAALRARRARMARREVSDSVEELASRNGHVDEVGVRAWVAALPERQRLAVYLRYYADLDYRAIASALDVEVGTVSATLSAAHRALRRSLEEVER
jgi:RNA polymerase sigma factor (sigma-70 family)